MRTLALAYKDINEKTYEKQIENNSESPQLETDLILIGIVGIKDPVRPEVPKAIQKCKESGIVVRMVTGDNVFTAKAIAKQCGILDNVNDIVMEGNIYI